MNVGEDLADQVRWAAFDLVRAGRSARVADLSAALRADPSTIEAAVGDLTARGLLERDSHGAVVGVHGLTLWPTRHRLVLDGIALYTWCALDAIGIPAALGIDAEVTTVCGWCAQSLRLLVDDGAPIADAPHVLWLPTSPCANVRADFCPLANLFCNTTHLESWRGQADVRGEVLTVAEAAALGRRWWRRTPGGCCDDGRSMPGMTG